jgi:hypothetical protein
MMMKKMMVLVAASMLVSAAFAQDVSLAQYRAQIPGLFALDDASAVAVIQQVYYPEIPVEQIAAKLGVVMPPPKPELGMVDKWRYQSCQQGAAEAPTPQGVIIKLRVCREKFGQ